MNAPTIADRLRKLAGRSMFDRAPLNQAPTAPEPVAPEPAPDAVADARNTLQDFAARLREFSTARADMDAAAHAERNAGKLDFAGLVERGQPLPDLTELTSRRAAAEVRTRACKQLLDRLAGQAHDALHAIRRDALANVKAARESITAAVETALPPGMFSPDALPGIVSKAAPVREALRRLEAVEVHGWPSVAVPAELFGMRCRDTRTEPLPVKPGISQPDPLAPDSLAREIDASLAVHLKAVRFILAATADPLAVMAPQS